MALRGLRHVRNITNPLRTWSFHKAGSFFCMLCRCRPAAIAAGKALSSNAICRIPSCKSNPLKHTQASFHEVIYHILQSNISYITDQYIIYYRVIYHILLYKTSYITSSKHCFPLTRALLQFLSCIASVSFREWFWSGGILSN